MNRRKTRKSGVQQVNRRIYSISAIITFMIALVIGITPAAQADYVGNNYLRNLENHLCLTAADGWVYSRECVLPIKSDKYQLWEPKRIAVKGGADIVQLRNVKTNTCLGQMYDGGSPYLVACSGASGGRSATTYWAGIGNWNRVQFHLYLFPASQRPEWTGRCLEGNEWQQVNAYGCQTGLLRQLWKLGM
jgi:hypothetical protein